LSQPTVACLSGNVREIKIDTSQQRLLQMLNTALGARIIALLEEPAVVELMLNPDGHLWVDRLGTGRDDTGYKILPADAQRVIELVASSTGSVCSADNPMVSAELPVSGHRFQGILPPVTSTPVFTIRSCVPPRRRRRRRSRKTTDRNWWRKTRWTGRRRWKGPFS